MWRKLLNIKKKRNSKSIDTGVINILDQLKSELITKNLIIKKELHQLTRYFNKIPLPYVIMGYDKTLIRANACLLSLLSCSTSECVGTNMVDYIHPDDVKIFKRYVKKLKKCKGVTNDDSNEIIIRILNNSGDVIYIKWGAVNLEEEQMIMLFGSDITHELELSDKLRCFISGKNRILDAYPGSVISIDIKGIITEFNTTAEKRSGYLVDEVINKKHIFELFPDKNLFHEDNLISIQKTDLRKKNGESELSYILLIPLLNQNDTLVGYLGVWHNKEYLNYIKSIE
jgi:PAS domain-containing protein